MRIEELNEEEQEDVKAYLKHRKERIERERGQVRGLPVNRISTTQDDGSKAPFDKIIESMRARGRQAKEG